MIIPHIINAIFCLGVKSSSELGWISVQEYWNNQARGKETKYPNDMNHCVMNVSLFSSEKTQTI